MGGAIPLIVHSPRWLLKHWAIHHIVPLFAGIKNNTRAMEGVRGMMIMFPSFLSGIKNNTRAMKEAKVR